MIGVMAIAAVERARSSVEVREAKRQWDEYNKVIARDRISMAIVDCVFDAGENARGYSTHQINTRIAGVMNLEMPDSVVEGKVGQLAKHGFLARDNGLFFATEKLREEREYYSQQVETFLFVRK